MIRSTATGWGFEAANGMLWPQSFESREDAIASIERETKEKWDVLQATWGIQMIMVEIRRADGLLRRQHTSRGFDLTI